MNDIMLLPGSTQNKPPWAPAVECWWDGPGFEAEERPIALKHLYETIPDQSPETMRRLALFFQDTLSLPNASWKDMIGRLEFEKFEKASDDYNFGDILAIYEYLDRIEAVSSAKELGYALALFLFEPVLFY